MTAIAYFLWLELLEYQRSQLKPTGFNLDKSYIGNSICERSCYSH
ncbi:hypothetical protein COO91_08463 [Nostoc flagelliforme CCNUN1]|uniref:Uncharacterized protein n=1 Tax=Nostoc flagelliforme CCNUN1 TaxID=2038116 RepID=A0A2K8T3Z5_9NOSO|nr:hypothetical protein COO91_08463 [Nostoc flagelliforme CCNUN1]